MAKALPDPFTPPALWELRVQLLGRTGRFACHRCGAVAFDPAGYIPPQKEGNTVPGGWVYVCSSCGALGAIFPGAGIGRALTPAELAMDAAKPGHAELRKVHDQVVERMIG